jgi:hypothetical protein
MKKNRSTSSDTLRGVIIPHEVDDDENVIAVSLSATDDEEYLIENGEKFLDLLQATIEASGVIKREKKRLKSIRIKRYRILSHAA